MKYVLWGWGPEIITKSLHMLQTQKTLKIDSYISQQQVPKYLPSIISRSNFSIPFCYCLMQGTFSMLPEELVAARIESIETLFTFKILIPQLARLFTFDTSSI